MTRSSWLNQLERWLIEVCCDSLAVWLYGEEGLDAIKTILAAYAIPQASSSHPDPLLRIAIQEAASVADLDSFKPADPFRSNETHATSALVALALPLRQFVHERAVESFDPSMDRAEAIARSVVTALEQGGVPSSSEWPEGEVGKKASAIESGLVRGLWRRYNVLAPNLPDSEVDMKRDIQFVSQAIDALEFAARFDSQRETLNADAEERMPLPNVLWLSKNGVNTKPSSKNGVPAFDLRLGRHFIVFQRSRVATIDSLEGEEQQTAVQREVEVGWGHGLILHPSELVLAVTFETLRLDNTCSAQVLSRSSLGRLGLLSATAVQVQPGYNGTLTLELVNLANVPLRISPGQRIAQIVPLPVLGSTDGYSGGYQNAGAKPAFSRSQKDWDAKILKGMQTMSL